MEELKINNKEPRILTDNDVKRKALKSVLIHIRKKIPANYEIMDQFNEWMAEMEENLAKPEFDKTVYYELRHKLNDIIERTVDGETRFKLRDSWISLGKALDKKMKPK